MHKLSQASCSFAKNKTFNESYNTSAPLEEHNLTCAGYLVEVFLEVFD